MIGAMLNRRSAVTLATVALLAGCKMIPKGPPEAPPPPVEEPSDTALPTDTQRHRIALLVPLSGPNASVGQAIANAATMALLDTNASNLRITNYDTATGAASAAAKAIADGNKLILGPLTAEDIPTVSASARPAKLTVVAFSNDEKAASRDVLVMGSVPSQSIVRSVTFARSQGASRFAALVPAGEYGQRASAALMETVRDGGGSVVAMETFDRSSTSLTDAARRLQQKGGFDTVLIADGGRIAAQAAPLLKTPEATGPRILGTELWSGERSVTTTPSLRGAQFSAISDGRFGQFSESYRSRFGSQPHRIATLGYDAVLMTLRIARNWRPGTNFPSARLFDKEGFSGLDGQFRFDGNGVAQRAFEVREVREGGTHIVSPAPTSFGN